MDVLAPVASVNYQAPVSEGLDAARRLYPAPSRHRRERSLASIFAIARTYLPFDPPCWIGGGVLGSQQFSANPQCPSGSDPPAMLRPQRIGPDPKMLDRNGPMSVSQEYDTY